MTIPARPAMPDLDKEQRARADALIVARRIVGRDADGSVDAMDVHALAQFVLNGQNPWESLRRDVMLLDDVDDRPRLGLVVDEEPEPGETP